VRDELLELYERELGYLRRAGADFAQKYPKVASRLLLEPNKCDDPHVERLLEGFAFLAARIHLKLQDDFPEISEALLGILYPQYIRPVPSLSIVQFHLDPDQGAPSDGLNISRGTELFTDPVRGTRYRFRTCYDTTLWPIEVTAAEWRRPHNLEPPVQSDRASDALRLELRCTGDVTFGELETEFLRFHLTADESLVSTLYELLCNNCVEILVRDPTGASGDRTVRLPGSAVRPVGFEEDEGVLPYVRRTHLAYRILQEYLVFPEKFFFLDIMGTDRIRAAGFGESIELIFLIRPYELADRRERLETSVGESTFRLGCTPIANLFQRTSEPLRVDRHKHEYVILPDTGKSDVTRIFSVDEVGGLSGGTERPLPMERLYSLRHGDSSTDRRAAVYWYARRRARAGSDRLVDVVLSFADRSGRAVLPDYDMVTARLTCFNGDYPSRMPFGRERGDFQVPGGLPISRAVALTKPTDPIYPPLGKPLLWRLISQLSINFMSLVDGGPETLQELLRLHHSSGSAVGEQRIQGIIDVKTSPMYARIQREHGLSFARGQRVEILFDEENFAGGGVYLMASVMERFLALFVSLNSFSALTARSRQRNAPVAEWVPRSGWKPLL
jgi:type VI secretion system protein ImpG